ncbi:prokineticin Bv8-like peptide 2 isoform X3 [Scyliorhinus canicula]|uniref:prokineticin Bv8-like peptide 2 isoform X3 n=1 Tax=Scyliorhinus canicula TaxID=7830 RepID=UPI0018F51408|nr:prokineticin Bv8-like peptide 2 isoform X3 [Scyliorhinus canicula]
MKNLSFALISFAAISYIYTAVITGACDRDLQCGGGTCCAVTLWLRSLRICTPMGNEGDECHPLSTIHWKTNASHLPLLAKSYLREVWRWPIQMFITVQN